MRTWSCVPVPGISTRPIRLPDLAELDAFVRAARAGSMSEAAAALRISKAGVSKRIAVLETLIGHAVLERTSRGVRPTARGYALLPMAERLLAAAAEIVQADDRTAGTDRLRISGVLGVLGAAGPSPHQLLLELEELFSVVFHAGAQAAIICRLESGTIVEANDAFCTLVGLERAQVLDHSAVELGLAPAEARLGFVEKLRDSGTLHRQHTTLETGRGPRHITYDAVLHPIRGDLYYIVTID